MITSSVSPEKYSSVTVVLVLSTAIAIGQRTDHHGTKSKRGDRYTKNQSSFHNLLAKNKTRGGKYKKKKNPSIPSVTMLFIDETRG